ncbi:hypothetical protein [Salinibacter altiplanensis]|uniref:hypothetical protein n=1 Tax=Salinibacter altiplanensis TaxID=1803181 RepID=UPI000C9F1324|nr:hypothetical protein [Salinibacter altiplanensis]
MVEDERQRAKQLVNEDRGAALYAEFLRDFYDRFGEERPTDPRVDAFVDALFQEEVAEAPENETATVIPVSSHNSGLQARPTVLAADAPPPRSPAVADSAGNRFVDLASLSSDGEGVLVRVVGDRQTGHGRLYVLSASGDKTQRGEAYAVVSFPELGRDILTDEEGRASFELRIGPEVENLRRSSLEKWTGISAVVRRPVASAEVRPKGTAMLPASGPPPEENSESEDAPRHGAGARLICRHHGARLSLSLGPAETDEPVLLGVSSPGADPFLVSLRSGAPEPAPIPSGKRLVLRLYE